MTHEADAVIHALRRIAEIEKETRMLLFLIGHRKPCGVCKGDGTIRKFIESDETMLVDCDECASRGVIELP